MIGIAHIKAIKIDNPIERLVFTNDVTKMEIIMK